MIDEIRSREIFKELNIADNKNMCDLLHGLISKANSWDKIEEFFNNNQIAKLYLSIAGKELHKDGCCSIAIYIIVAIEKMIEDLDLEV